jgi:flagellar biosynthetic protein FlhB
MQSVVEFVKGIFKLIIVSLVAYNSIKSELPQLKLSHDLSIAAVLSLTLKLSVKMMIGICISMAIIAALDYLYQRHEFFKALRMSKHELKEEYRETEGSPEIKGKLKSMRMERAKQRMMAAVPKADVIITNPTHFSVALKYDMKKMRAPVVVAKGIDEIALRIREVAKKHDIPLYENAPLARTLYANVELDKEIPVEHYKAVAEIISYVYKLKNKMPG